MTFGDQVFHGKDADLLPVSFDVSQWTDIEITVKDKVVTIKINNQDVFSTRFTRDTKFLTGLGYISNGLVEVDVAELAGLDGKVMSIGGKCCGLFSTPDLPRSLNNHLRVIRPLEK